MTTEAAKADRFVVFPHDITPAITEALESYRFIGNPITEGVITASAVAAWVGIEPLPPDQMFMLKSWDEPVERDPGWEYYEDGGPCAHALDLIAWRIERPSP